jgi:hypothetical protein
VSMILSIYPPHTVSCDCFVGGLISRLQRRQPQKRDVLRKI